MKTFKLLAVAAVCALCCALALAGCGGSQGSTASPTPVTTENIVGYWTNVPDEELNFDDVNAEDGESASAASASAESASSEASSSESESSDVVVMDDVKYPLVMTYLEISDDGTASLFIGGYAYDATWAIEGETATLVCEGSTPATLKLVGDKLIMSQEGLEVTLTKGTSEDGLATTEGTEVEYVEPVIQDIEPVTVANDDSVTIAITGKGTDFTNDPCFRISVTNKTGNELFVGVDDIFKVGDKEINAGLGDYVAGGETIDDMLLYFPADELGGGLDQLVNVSGEIVVYSVGSEDELGDAVGTYAVTM